jgi:hypothetical protein
MRTRDVKRTSAGFPYVRAMAVLAEGVPRHGMEEPQAQIGPSLRRDGPYMRKEPVGTGPDPVHSLTLTPHHLQKGQRLPFPFPCKGPTSNDAFAGGDDKRLRIPSLTLRTCRSPRSAACPPSSRGDSRPRKGALTRVEGSRPPSLTPEGFLPRNPLTASGGGCNEGRPLVSAGAPR